MIIGIELGLKRKEVKDLDNEYMARQDAKLAKKLKENDALGMPLRALRLCVGLYRL